MNKPILIGIAGGTASGKTSIAQKIRDLFSNTRSVIILRMDDYYKDRSELSMEERAKINYDHPLAFDTDLCISQLKDLLNGKAIDKPLYDFTVHNRSSQIEHIEPADVVIIEGLFVLENEVMRSLEQIKVFVDTEADIRFIRRMIRDVRERGRTLDSVVDQYVNTVRVMHETFVEPTKRFADIIIPEGASNLVAVDLLATKIRSIISGSSEAAQ